MFKASLQSFLYAIGLSEGPKIALTNVLLIAFTALLMRSSEPHWIHLIAFTLALAMYAYERVLSAQENERFWILRRDESKVEAKITDDFKKLSDQVQALQNQVVLSNRGY